MADGTPGDWCVERGIGEERALLTIGGQIVAAKMHWPGELSAGRRVQAQLTTKRAGARRGTATTGSGQTVLVDHLPDHVTQGESFTMRISRAAIAERGRFKHAHGRYCDDKADERSVWMPDARPAHEFASGFWEDIWEAAASGEVHFAGGSLILSVTPAMTLIDIDGEGSPKELSLKAIPAIAHWIRAFDLGGNIGIDFPTIEAKKDRKAVDEAFDEALHGWPHERTAMNGFGFVQLVARLEGPSLLHRFAASRTGMCARYALRVAELAEGSGRVLLLTLHPALKAKLKREWLEELARRTGKEVRIETDPGLALETPQAQIIAA